MNFIKKFKISKISKAPWKYSIELWVKYTSQLEVKLNKLLLGAKCGRLEAGFRNKFSFS